MREGTAITSMPLFSCRQMLRHLSSESSFLEQARTLSAKSAARRPLLHWLYIAFINFVLLAIFTSTTGTAEARILEASKKGGEYEVRILIDRNPPMIGANNIEVEIRDSGGRTVSDAAVLINYYMPPMPRMVPMFYRTDASGRGGKYRATMNFVMSGPWIIAVKITFGGKTTTARFNVDAQ